MQVRSGGGRTSGRSSRRIDCWPVPRSVLPKLETRWIGPPPEAAPTIVFLHEGLGCAALWRDFPDRVAEATGCGALVYSRVGYGLSAPVQGPRSIRFMHEEAEMLP